MKKKECKWENLSVWAVCSEETTATVCQVCYSSIVATDFTQTLKNINFQGWITNELDSWADPFDGALRSFKYVQSHFK